MMTVRKLPPGYTKTLSSERLATEAADGEPKGACCSRSKDCGCETNAKSLYSDRADQCACLKKGTNGLSGEGLTRSATPASSSSLSSSTEWQDRVWVPPVNADAEAQQKLMSSEVPVGRAVPDMWASSHSPKREDRGFWYTGDFPPPGEENCEIQVWQSTIFWYVIHMWIEVKHCDGTRERFDIWKTADEEANKIHIRTLRPGQDKPKPGERGIAPFGKAGPGNTEPKKIAGCTKEIACEKKKGKLVEPKMCQCFSAATAMKYGPQNTYTATGINSNTFVAHFLKHCGMKCDFPSGSIGSGILTRPREDLFRITPKEFERLLKEGRGHLPGGWRSH